MSLSLKWETLTEFLAPHSGLSPTPDVECEAVDGAVPLLPLYLSMPPSADKLARKNTAFLDCGCLGLPLYSLEKC